MLLSFDGKIAGKLTKIESFCSNIGGSRMHNTRRVGGSVC